MVTGDPAGARGEHGPPRARSSASDLPVRTATGLDRREPGQPSRTTRKNRTRNQRGRRAHRPELTRLLDHARSSRLLFEFMAYTGLRIGESVRLRWRDVDLAVGVVHVEQQGGSRLRPPAETSSSEAASSPCCTSSSRALRTPDPMSWCPATVPVGHGRHITHPTPSSLRCDEPSSRATTASAFTACDTAMRRWLSPLASTSCLSPASSATATRASPSRPTPTCSTKPNTLTHTARAALQASYQTLSQRTPTPADPSRSVETLW